MYGKEWWFVPFCSIQFWDVPWKPGSPNSTLGVAPLPSSLQLRHHKLHGPPVLLHRGEANEVILMQLLGKKSKQRSNDFFSKERLRHLLLHVGSVGTIFLVTVIMIPKWDGIWKTWNDQQPLRPLLPSFSSEPRENQEIAFPKWSPKKEQLA